MTPITPELREKFLSGLRHGFHFCCACQHIIAPMDCGEANLQRCPECDSARISWNPAVITSETMKTEIGAVKPSVSGNLLATFIAHDWCGWNERYGRYTAMPNGETLTCQAWMGQLDWDAAQLKWLEQFDERLVVHKCPNGPYHETGNTMGTVAEIKSRLKGRKPSDSH